MFVDRVVVKLKAGNGGNGIVSFRREAHVPLGGPNGGDGGNGGSIYFMVDTNKSTLLDLRYNKKITAKNGENGKSKKMHGANGADVYVKVPQGTMIKDAATNELICDLCEPEQNYEVCKGGKGGRGNYHFASGKDNAPEYAEQGTLGESKEVILELKLLADVGLVGFPNVGKSTLISVVSAAKPKIANYHFTTLTPVLGMVRVAEEQSFVMADIPGLIEGASDGIGLGHDFLRHVERCRLILHVVDVSGSEGRDPIADYETIQGELKRFREDLADRPQIVVANKCDMAQPEQIARFRSYIEEKGLQCLEISAATTAGTAQLVQETAAMLQTLPPILQYEAQAPSQQELEEKAHGKFEIEVEDGIYYVHAPFLEPILRTVNMDDYSSLQYFQRVLRSSGIIDALEERGIAEGDTVDIMGFEFDFVP